MTSPFMQLMKQEDPLRERRRRTSQPTALRQWQTGAQRSPFMELMDSTPKSQDAGETTESTPRMGRYLGIKGFEGEERTDSVIQNVKMDASELVGAYQTLGSMIAEDFESGNYTRTLFTIAKELPSAMVTSYTRWYDAYKQGRLTEAIQKYPLQFAQDVTLPATIALGGASAAAKAAGATGQAVKSLQTMATVANAVGIASDPIGGAISIGIQKGIGKAYGAVKGGAAPGPQLDITPEHVLLAGKLEKMGMPDPIVMADDIIQNPAKWKNDARIYDLYEQNKKDLDLPSSLDDISMDQISRDILEADMDGVTPTDKYAARLNIDRIRSSDELDRVITKTAELMEQDPARFGNVKARYTFESDEALAAASGFNLEDLMKVKDRQAMNAPQVAAARMVAENARLNFYQKLKSVQLNQTPRNLIEFDHAAKMYVAAHDKMAGISSEAGRALAIHRRLPPMAKQTNAALRQILDTLGGGRKIEEMVKALGNVVDDSQLIKMARDLQKATTWEKFREAWMMGVLSGPTTQAVNIGSNALVAAYTNGLENLVAMGIGKTRQAFGKAAKAIGMDVEPQQAITAAEMAGRMKGFGQGMGAGAKEFARTWRTGESASLFSPYEFQHTRALKSKAWTPLRMISLNMLSAGDNYFKMLNYTAEINAMAVRDGVRKGLSGKSLTAHIQKFLATPTKDAQEAAMQFARQTTYTDALEGNWFKDAGAAIMKLRDAKVMRPLQLIIPFVRTPVNIMDWAMKRSPLAIFLEDWRAEVAAGGIRRDKAIAQVLTGTAIGYWAFNQAMDGKITGTQSTERAERDLQWSSGRQPYSILHNGSYWSYSRMEPAGTIIGIAADLANITQRMNQAQLDGNRGDIEKIPALIAASITNNFTNKTYMQGLANFIEAVDKPDRKLQDFLSGMASSVVPTFAAQIARWEDPFLREAKTTIEKIQDRIPFERKQLALKVGYWGEDIERETPASIVNPIYRTRHKNDKTSNEMLRLQQVPSMPGKTIQGVELNPEQYRQLVKIARTEAKEVLDAYVNDPTWDATPDFEKAMVIEKVLRRYNDYARRMMLATDPDLAQKVMAERMRRVNPEMRR